MNAGQMERAVWAEPAQTMQGFLHMERSWDFNIRVGGGSGRGFQQVIHEILSLVLNLIRAVSLGMKKN